MFTEIVIRSQIQGIIRISNGSLIEKYAVGVCNESVLDDASWNRNKKSLLIDSSLDKKKVVHNLI